MTDLVRMMIAAGAAVSLVLAGHVARGQQQASARATLEITAGASDREQVPVVCELPESLRHAQHLRLVCQETGTAVPVQKLTGAGAQVAWILGQRLPAGSTRTYVLQELTGLAQEESVACRDTGGQLILEVRGKPVLAYHYKEAVPPADINPVYARSGFIHPLWSPAGRLLTDDFPPDHAHQHGIFTAWVNTTLGDRKIDFWNQLAETGDVRHRAISRVVSGPVFAEFEVVLEHVALEEDQSARPVLEETWTVRAYNVGETFLVDFQSRQVCVADVPLELNEYHYGGFGYRGHRNWKTDSPFDFLTSEGHARIEGNHTRARWVVAQGPIDGQPAYAAVLCHPENSRAPQPVRLHPTMPYFSYAPVVLGQFELNPGDPYVTQFRFVAADGTAEQASIDRLWQDYARPPEVAIR